MYRRFENASLIISIALIFFGAIPCSAAPPPYEIGLGFREQKAGWIFAHLEGKPKEIGYQYGYLMAAEIDEADRALQLFLKNDTGKDWSFYRETAQRLFWNKVDPEYKEELQGMADGLKARGFHYDVTDMLAHNSWIEIAWYYLPYEEARNKKAESKAPLFCSAFIATGGATKDGKIIMAHNAWIHYILGERWNLILDIRPLKGNRILMDAWPGFIHSGDDFAINSAGIMITETTIGGFVNFDEKGTPEFVRARRAEQYAGNLDDFVEIMKSGNNGGYANTWLIGDIKTNEIGKLELGLKNVTYSHTGDGSYVGSNFPENPKLIAEECEVDLSSFSNSCSDRKARWLKLMKDMKGKIDIDQAKLFLADTRDEVHQKDGSSLSTLNAHGENDQNPPSPGMTPFYPFGTVNAKVISSELARKMEFWGRIGFPDGSVFKVKPYLMKHPEYRWMRPFLRDIDANPWNLFEIRDKLTISRQY